MALLGEIDGKAPLEGFSFRRLLLQAIGLALLLAAMLLALAFLTYDHADPSWNHVVGGSPTRCCRGSGWAHGCCRSS